MQVKFEDVEKRYGDFSAVKGLNLTIEKGALHFLLGPSGCGKTTTLRMLAGLEQPTAGRIKMDGKDVTHLSAQDRGIGMVFQNYALWPHMTVRKNVEYGLKLKKLSTNEVETRLQEVLKITQLERFQDRLPGQLSGGQQQRVALARALAVRPNVLLLDEPLSNLDAKLRLEMRENICRIHKETGITTVYVTHDQKEALSMGTGVSIMYSGHLLQTDSPRKLYNSPKTAFVASFIGEANMLPGKLLTVDGDRCEVDAPIGRLSGKLSDRSLKVGHDVVMAIRPESIRIHDDQPLPSINEFAGTLNDTIYLGESEQFRFHAPARDDVQFKVMAMNFGDHGFKSQDKVPLAVAHRDVLVLAPDVDLGLGT